MYLIVAVLVAVAGTMIAEDGSEIDVIRLTDTLYQLTTDQGAYTTNTIASVGEDGVLLVDTQAEGDADRLKEVVDGFGKGTPKIIINTHRHVEHVGGNAVFGPEPVIIAHSLVPSKLRSGSYIFNEFPDATFPDITIDDSMSVFFNGEEIRLIAMPGSHDDNEVIVHFTESKVVHLSSLVNGFNFPSVDSDGSVLEFAGLVERAMEMLPTDVVIVSGHNDNGSWQDLQAYYDMLVGTIELVRQGLAAGKDVETLQAEDALDEWKSYAGSYVSVDQWIEYVVQALVPVEEKKKSIYEPLYYAMQDGGTDSAVKEYSDLKLNHADEYDFRDIHLLVIGDKLLDRGQIREAIAFFELSLQEFPDGEYAYYVKYELALAHDKLGDTKTALRYCEKAIQQNPDSQAINSLLEKLKNKI